MDAQDSNSLLTSYPPKKVGFQSLLKSKKLLEMNPKNIQAEQKVKVSAAQSCLTFATPWTVAHQAPLPVGFSRQEHWGGLPFPPGDRLDPGIKPRCPALAGGFVPVRATREAVRLNKVITLKIIL